MTRGCARHWCLEEYCLRRHSTTQRLPREHFEAEEQPALLAAPWTRMRQLFKLLSLANKYRGRRLDACCRTALDADMVDVHRLGDLVRLDTRLEPPPAQVIPLARYLRPASQYALPLARRSGSTKETNRDPRPDLAGAQDRAPAPQALPHARHPPRALRPGLVAPPTST